MHAPVEKGHCHGGSAYCVLGGFGVLYKGQNKKGIKDILILGNSVGELAGQNWPDGNGPKGCWDRSTMLLLSMLLPTFLSFVARSATKVLLLLLLFASEPVMEIFSGNGVSRTLSLEERLCEENNLTRSKSSMINNKNNPNKIITI